MAQKKETPRAIKQYSYLDINSAPTRFRYPSFGEKIELELHEHSPLSCMNFPVRAKNVIAELQVWLALD